MAAANRSRVVPPFLLRRLWTVWTDHTVSGVYGSKKAAFEACRLRRAHAGDGFEPFVIGPYILSAAGLRAWSRA